MDDKPEECQICLQSIANYALLSHCDHQFCLACIMTWSRTNPTCPCCRAPVSFVVDADGTQHTFNDKPKAPPTAARTRRRPTVWLGPHNIPDADYNEMAEDDESYSSSDASEELLPTARGRPLTRHREQLYIHTIITRRSTLLHRNALLGDQSPPPPRLSTVRQRPRRRASPL